MKEETKKKICKISKIVGFAITFGFAVFGALCAAMLIGNGGKKDDIKTLDNSLVLNEVRSELNIKPRKAPDFEGAYDYFDQSYHFDSMWYDPVSDTNLRFFNASWGRVACFPESRLPNGYYYLESDVGGTFWFSVSVSSSHLEDFRSVDDGNLSEIIVPVGGDGVGNSDSSSYVYINWDNIGHGNLLFFRNYHHLYLVDTLELPSTSSVYLGENWNPLKAFGDNISPKGGYLIRNQSWTYGTYTLPSLQLNGLLFKYEGEVFDRINITLWPLNATHTPYVDSSGNVITPSDNSGTQEIYGLQSVSFSQSWNNVADLGNGIYLKYSVPVLSASRADTPVGGKFPYNGSVIWASQSRTIEVIDDKGTTGERFDNRFLGMTDLELVKFLSQYQSEAIDVVNTGGMFSLFTNAFDSLMPILSIAILPNITLGMILFIPLVGGIIVVIIRLVKK